MQKTKNKDPDFIDSEINFVQRQYIQPIARIEAEVYYHTSEAKQVESTALASTDYLVYQAEHYPIKPYSENVYIASVETTRGAATYPTMDYEAGTFTFPSTHADVTADYETLVVERTSDIATDIYELNFISDVTDGTRWPGVNLLNDFETQEPGIRRHNDRLYFHSINGERTLKIGYHKEITDLSETNATPEIDAQWHDLYWLGACAMIDPQYYGLFTDRLREYKLEVLSESRPHGQKMKVSSGWLF